MKPHGHAGSAEVARMIGVSRQRLHALRRTYPDFPKPVTELAHGPVWHTADIDRWLLIHWDRPPGRRINRA